MACGDLGQYKLDNRPVYRGGVQMKILYEKVWICRLCIRGCIIAIKGRIGRDRRGLDNPQGVVQPYDTLIASGIP